MTLIEGLFIFLMVVLLSTEIHGDFLCMPDSPGGYACTDSLFTAEEMAELELQTVGGVKQKVDGSEAEKAETHKTIVAMALYLRNLKKTHPDVAQKWCVWNCSATGRFVG